MPERVDLNGDVGEGIGQDAELIPQLTSANIACGGHAGDAATMRQTVALARAHGVAVGAHPSFPDRDGFGRRALPLPPHEVEASVSAQIGELAAIAASQQVPLRHVKPHGALYNMAARDARLADAIARAVAAVDPTLVLVGLAGSALVEAGARAGLQTANEGFADRAYTPAGTLVPRDEPGAVIHDPALVAARAVAMVRERAVTAIDGSRVALTVDTICVHGDTPGAAALARALREALVRAGVEMAPIGSR